MRYVIGIDGGGTKTECLLADEEGNVVASAIGGPTNPNVVKPNVIRTTLEALLRDVNNQAVTAFSKVTNLFAGMSGAGEETYQNVIKQILVGLLPQTVTVDVYPDPVNALYSGTFGKTGIVQISGTGSITYGVNNERKHDRVGGWGYLFGDEGSGYAIGRQGVTEALKAFDGRGRQTIILEMLYDHFNVSTGHELIRTIYAADQPKEKIAPLSKIVLQAYKKQDPVAQKIIAGVVDDIQTSIITLHRKLFQPNESVELVLCGGVFHDKHILPPLIEKAIDQEMITLVLPEVSPAKGSLVGAYLSMGKEVDNNSIENLKAR